MSDLPELLTTDQLAAELGVSKRTLDHWRYMGSGPDYCKLGGRVRYRRDAVEQWISASTISPSGRG